jgi:sarcosine oxidase
VTPVEHADIVVVGAGITGLSAAWALARRGREVLVLEQAEVGHRNGGSHGSCRIFRLGYEYPEYVRLAQRARDLWAELDAASGERLLHPVPQLTFGPEMEQVRESMRAAGARCELLTVPESAERFPAVAAPGPVLLEPDSAVIAADRALAALDRLSQAVRPGVRVTAIADHVRGVGISTTDGVIEAGRVIVCAGPWTAGLLSGAGIEVPGSATLEQIAYLNSARELPIIVHYGGASPYGLPEPGTGRYKIGIHHGGPDADPDHQVHQEDADLAERTERAVRALLPTTDPRPVAVERCVYDNSPDTDFIADRVGNVVVGSGTSGHGFKFGPLLGEWLADLAVGSPADIPARFSLARF